MKRIRKDIGILLLFCATLPLLSSCNNTDDLTEIFTGKTWKMSRLTNKNSEAPFYPGIWDSQEAMDKSLNQLKREECFTLNFEGTELDGEMIGASLSGRGISTSFTGTWSADGKNQSLTLSLKTDGSTEGDPLAKAFINGLRNVYKYEGDANSLTLFYKDKDSGATRVIGFSHNR